MENPGESFPGFFFVRFFIIFIFSFVEKNQIACNKFYVISS